MRAAIIGAGQISKQHLGALATCSRRQHRGHLRPIPGDGGSCRGTISRRVLVHRLSAMLAEKRPDVSPHSNAAFHPLFDCSRLPASRRSRPGGKADCRGVFPARGTYCDRPGRAKAARGRSQLSIQSRIFKVCLELVQRGGMGQLRHVDIDLCLAIDGRRSRFAAAGSQNGTAHGSPTLIPRLSYASLLSGIRIHRRTSSRQYDVAVFARMPAARFSKTCNHLSRENVLPLESALAPIANPTLLPCAYRARICGRKPICLSGVSCAPRCSGARNR